MLKQEKDFDPVEKLPEQIDNELSNNEGSKSNKDAVNEKKGSSLKNVIKDELSNIVTENKEWMNEVRGIVLMLGIVLNIPAKTFQNMLLKNGLLTIATAGNILRMLPPMIISIEETNKAIDLIIKSCNDIDNEMKNLKKS